tara:strand:+ start:1617 stop:1745 length:129 start_codon:yes stop_codon:yes gene_type:complete
MKEENNKPKNLQKLWKNNLITSTEYFFRLQANKLKIKTYKNK